MPGRPGAIRESRVEGRPRNPDVEQAWSSYALSYELWQQTSAKASSNTHNQEYAIALVRMKQSRDDALFTYLEEFDKDQREVFG